MKQTFKIGDLVYCDCSVILHELKNNIITNPAYDRKCLTDYIQMTEEWLPRDSRWLLVEKLFEPYMSEHNLDIILLCKMSIYSANLDCLVDIACNFSRYMKVKYLREPFRPESALLKKEGAAGILTNLIHATWDDGVAMMLLITLLVYTVP